MFLFTKPLAIGAMAIALLSSSSEARARGGGLEAKLKSMGSHVSAMVVNLATGEKVLQVNPSSPMNPASSIKLFTAYTALKRLGTNHTFKTSVFVNNSGAICVKGGGDPSFVMEDLYLVVEQLKRKGIESYSGAITLDASVYDDELYPEGRGDQDSERAYNAPIAGLNFNYNTITVFVNPRGKGEPAYVGLDYPFDFVKVNGKVTTGSGTDVTWDKKGKGDQEIVTIGGKIAAHADEWHKPFRIRNPSMAFGEAFSKQLKMAGIGPKSAVTVKTGKCSSSADADVVYESKPLSFVVQLMDKYSNNFIADSLIKTLDHEVNQRQGTAEGGLKIVRADMKSIGIDLSSNGRNMQSGSGLTRDNRASASDFVALLTKVYHEKLYLPELLTSLPIAALDGTLKRKYGGTPAALRLRGKTGTLDGVQSLVGVYPNDKGEYLAVAVITNGATIPEKELGEFLGGL
jgi:D-alanyl-D-alanine carboxypeptidase/D-alanyl-D-alanine-endopeptidase (penicillin-binding protein 4)